MAEPLIYQSTNTDSAPVAILNALRYLYTRDELNANVLKGIYSLTLDTQTKSGEAITSRAAMIHIASYLNEQSRLLDWDLETVLCTGPEVFIGPGCKLYSYLKNGGVAVYKILLDEKPHYITFTGLSHDYLYFFDPLYREEPFASSDVEIINDKPFSFNRRIAISVIKEREKNPYLSPNLMDRELLLFSKRK